MRREPFRGPRDHRSPLPRGNATSVAGGLRAELKHLVDRLVETPAAVQLKELRQGATTLYELRVAPDDLGKVIGRQGRTARALRTLLEVRGSRDGRKYGLEIRES